MDFIVDHYFPVVDALEQRLETLGSKMPELDWRWGYPVVLGAMAALCAFLYSRFKRSSWL